MSVSREELARLARLARLHLDPEEAEGLTDDLARILDHARTLKDVDGDPETADAPPSSEGGLHAPSPADAPPPPDPLRRAPSELAPAWRDGFFVVPRLAPLDRDDGEEKGT